MTSISIRRDPHADILTRQFVFHPIENLTALIFAALLLLTVLFPLRVNHDVGLFLETGSLIVDGKTPYVDFAEINFPLVMYLHAVPVAIARVLNVNPIPVFSMLVLALAIGSAVSVRTLLNRHYRGAIPLLLRLVPTFIALYSLYLFLIVEYGQREHLFMLLFLPGFVLSWIRWQGGRVDRRFALLIGLMAGVGMAIKPHFLVVAFAVQAYWIIGAFGAGFKPAFRKIKSALLTPEILGIVGFGALYAGALLFAPAIRTALFDEILPYVTSSYSSYGVGVTPLTLLWRLDTVLMWMGLIIALPLALRNRPLARPLWILTLTAILVFCWQGKGWYYHRIPAIFGVSLLLLMTIVEHSHSRLPLLGTAMKILVVMLGYAVITLGGVVQTTDRTPGLRDVILKYSQPGDPVMIINSSVDPAYPLLVQTGRHAADRNLTGFAIGSDPATDHDLAGYLNSLAQSIDTRQPPLILIDAQAQCYGCAPGAGMLPYLQKIGFINNYVSPEYQVVGVVNQFEVYVRRETQPMALAQGGLIS